MNSLMTINNVTTMTSKEIAELTGKQHFHVLRDIDDMLLELQHPKLDSGFQLSEYIGKDGKPHRMYEMDRDSSYCLVAGYDVNARMRIIKRWQELESKNIPKTFAEALRLASDQQFIIEAQATQMALDKPKVKFYEAIEEEQQSMSIGDYAKMLSDTHKIVIGPNKLFEFLRKKGYLMKGRDSLEANKPYVQYSMAGNGWFDITYHKTQVGMKTQTLITFAGQIELSDMIIDHFRF